MKRKSPADIVRPSPEVEAAFVAGVKPVAVAVTESKPAGRPRSFRSQRVALSSRVMPDLLDDVMASASARNDAQLREGGERFSLVDAIDEALRDWLAKQSSPRREG